MTRHKWMIVRSGGLTGESTTSMRCLVRVSSVALFRRLVLGIAITAAIAVSGVAVSSGQSGIPDVRGLYEGPVTWVLSDCDDPDSIVTFTFPWSIYCFEQTGASFRCGDVDPEGNPTGFLSGTVTATGAISGTYSLTLGESITESGTFTGQITAGTFSANLVGKITAAPPDVPPEFLCETYSFSGDRVSATTTSDVRITSTAAPDPVASGARLTYTYQISNAGPDAAPGVTVATSILEGTSFVSSSVSQGTFTTPLVGSTGQLNIFLGTIAANESATVTLTVNVLAAAGQSLSNTANVASLSNDPKPNSNSVTTDTAIRGGAVVKLIWDQPAPTSANPTPAPINLRIEPGSFTAADVTTPDSATVISPAADASCTLSRVNVYKSDAQPVLLILDNLWKSVSPDQLQTAMAAAPGGSFYVITNVWQCGEMTVESGASNQAGSPAGPTLSRVKVGGKIKIIGSGFTDPAQVFFDGIAFAKQAVFSDSTRVVQKGLLADGRSAFDVATPGKTVIISVRNSNGGISSIAFTGQ
jgi:uncharacterized repeat protein (TIGR01451 family)